jgi:hypothetical protein
VRRWEIQCNPAIDRLTACIDKRHITRVPRVEQLAAQRQHCVFRRSFTRSPERQPDYADTPTPRRCSDRDNRIGVVIGHGYFQRNASERVVAL